MCLEGPVPLGEVALRPLVIAGQEFLLGGTYRAVDGGVGHESIVGREGRAHPFRGGSARLDGRPCPHRVVRHG